MRHIYSLALFFAAVPLWAQPALPITPAIPTPAITALKQYLNLTDAQVTSLTAIVQQKASAIEQVNQQIAQKNQSLATMLASANPNPTTVGQTLIDIQNLEKQLAPTTEPYHTEALAILTPAQATLLSNLNTALQLQATACEAVNVNLLVLPTSSFQSGTISILSPVSSCATGIIGVLTPGVPITLPGGVVPPLPSPGQ
ncbi:MAG TPA: hypothetical protein VKU19_31305 [Bryobacteraceae bacterium]|nr:hypothetical protein [Bryobacteraceae bacterium]